VNAPTPRPTALRVWLAAIRPQTLTASLAPVAAGTALAAADGALRWGPACAALGGAIGIQVGTNLINDWSDFRKGADTEDRLGPARAAQQGWLTSRQILTGAVLCFALAVAFGAYLVWTAGWPLLALGVVSIGCGVAYTCGPYPLAYTGLAEPFVLAFFGVAAVSGTYYVQAGQVSPGSVLIGVALGLLATGILVVNNLRDRHTDARADKRTLAVRWGAGFARSEYTACLALAFAAPTAAWAAGLGHAGWLAPLAALPLAASQLRGVWCHDGAELNQHLGGTARLELVFALLFALGVWPWS